MPVSMIAARLGVIRGKRKGDITRVKPGSRTVEDGEIGSQSNISVESFCNGGGAGP